MLLDISLLGHQGLTLALPSGELLREERPPSLENSRKVYFEMRFVFYSYAHERIMLISHAYIDLGTKILQASSAFPKWNALGARD